MGETLLVTSETSSRDTAGGCLDHGALGIWVLPLGRLSEKSFPSRCSKTKRGERGAKWGQRLPSVPEVTHSPWQAEQHPKDPILQMSCIPTPFRVGRMVLHEFQEKS